jgi:hypothetical protein
MPFSSITAVDCVVVVVSIYFVLLLQDHRKRGGLPYPPGPQSWPIIGICSMSRADIRGPRTRNGPRHTVRSYLSLILRNSSSGRQVMSCLFEFLARSWWCCLHRKLSRICLNCGEKRTQIGPRFLFTKCKLTNVKPCLFYLPYNPKMPDSVWIGSCLFFPRAKNGATVASY